MTHGTLEVDAGTLGILHVAWRSKGAGTPTLLIHPYPTNGSIWRNQLEAAAWGDLSATLVAFDLPGFGDSPAPELTPDAYQFDDLVRVAASVVDRLGLQRPIVAGVGIGGTIAAALTRSVAIRALVLVGNKAGTDPPERAAAREAMAAEVVRVGSGAVSDRLAMAALSPSATAETREAVAEMIAGADPRAIAALGRLIARRPDVAPLLQGFDGPMLLVAGGDDGMSPPATVEQLARLVPRAEFRRVPGAGHLLPVEAPRAMTELLAEAVAAARAD